MVLCVVKKVMFSFQKFAHLLDQVIKKTTRLRISITWGIENKIIIAES